MSRSLAALAALVALVTSVAEAQESESAYDSIGELALSNDTVQLKYERTQDLVVEDTRLSGAFFLSEERDTVFSAGLAFPPDVDWGPLFLAFGPQVYAAFLRDENEDVLSVSVGAQVRFSVYRALQLAVAGHAYYAPDILSFGSADSLTDLGARLEMGLGPRLIAFGGMRWFEFDLTEGMGERTLQEEIFVGFGYRF
jgi:hypothetical protein